MPWVKMLRVVYRLITGTLVALLFGCFLLLFVFVLAETSLFSNTTHKPGKELAIILVAGFYFGGLSGIVVGAYL